jgi:CRP-like cAMP-binding protein
MNAARIEELRAQWDRAVERDRPSDAVAALTELEELEDEPRWSQRLGEALRRLGKTDEAEEAFVRAAERYSAKGFSAHAIAMAKLVASINPSRAGLLARIEPPRPPGMPRIAPPVVVRPVPLTIAEDSRKDEIRFMDLTEPSSIDIVLADVESVSTIDSVDIIAVEDEDDEGDVTMDAPVPIPMSDRLPPAAEPSIDRLGAMATFRLFAGLSRETLLELADAAELVELVPNAMMMFRNEPATALYAIIDGTARVTVRGSPEIRVGEGDVVGEGCLLDEGERQADVRAETRVMALRIEKDKLDEVVKNHEALGDALFQLLARRLLMNLMHASPLFTAFAPKVRLELAQLFEVRRAHRGTVLAERGKRSDGLYVLLAGNITAMQSDGEETRVARGSAFGHASLVGTVSADATVIATTDAVLLRLPAAKFSALAASYGPALAILAETAEEPLPASLLPPS